jgi:aspartyl-tRNA(Asn)/glutamyl-tRNA(Gln) amidotransferase subunit A
MAKLSADTLFLSVRELGEKLRRREFTSSALTELALDRLSTIGKDLNAVATLTPERARAEAKRADADLERGNDRGPLHGIPYGAKDLLDTAGIRTTWGAKPFEQRVPDSDATVVARLKDAGAVLCAKLSMAELAGGLGYHVGNASLQGPMRNPWNRERWAGGSSSGSGASVAAGLVPYAIGTETWGSILCPSNFCGVTGLRPTFGRVSRHGAMALSWTLDKIGPIARSLDDDRLVLDAIAGPDPLDAASANMKVSWRGADRGGNLKGLRAALIPSDFAKNGDPETGAAFDHALAMLRAAGLTIEEAKLPDLPYEAAAIVALQAEVIAAFGDLYQTGDVRKLVDERAPIQAEVARAITGTDYVHALRLRLVMQRAMNQFFEGYDLIVAPGFLKVAPGVTADMDTYFSGSDPVGGMGNLTGVPMAALPMGLGKDKLPVGFQLVAPAFDEAILLRVGMEYQRRTNWHRARPLA